MKKIWTGWCLFFLLTLAFAIINRYFFRIPCMIPLEFAGSPETMNKYIMAGGLPAAESYRQLLYNTVADYGFLISYSFLTFFSFRLLLDVFQLPVKSWVWLLSFITGILDAIENIFLLRTALDNHEYFSGFYYWIVRIKWAFAVIPMLLIPMIIVYGLILLLRTRKKMVHSLG